VLADQVDLLQHALLREAGPLRAQEEVVDAQKVVIAPDLGAALRRFISPALSTRQESRIRASIGTESNSKPSGPQATSVGK
jgi:hypothetical protein